MDHGTPIASSGEARAFAADSGSQVSYPTHAQVWATVDQYVKANLENVCALGTAFEGYKAEIEKLDSNTERQKIGGFPVCFPNATAWESRPEVRDKLLAILRDNNVVQ